MKDILYTDGYSLKTQYMKYAINIAKQSLKSNNVPVGAVIVYNNNNIISAFHNDSSLSIYHAEILCIIEASKILQSKYLYGCDIYVTIEPCIMCAHALSLSKISRIIFGAYNNKTGSIDNGPRIFDNYNLYKPKIIGGILETECTDILQTFFKNIRK